MSSLSRRDRFLRAYRFPKYGLSLMYLAIIVSVFGVALTAVASDSLQKIWQTDISYRRVIFMVGTSVTLLAGLLYLIGLSLCAFAPNTTESRPAKISVTCLIVAVCCAAVPFMFVQMAVSLQLKSWAYLLSGVLFLISIYQVCCLCEAVGFNVGSQRLGRLATSASKWLVGWAVSGILVFVISLSIGDGAFSSSEALRANYTMLGFVIAQAIIGIVAVLYHVLMVRKGAKVFKK